MTRLTCDQMMEYFRQRYSPRNMVLVAAGNIDFDALVSLADRCCGHWPPFDASRETRRAAPHRGLQLFHKPAAVQQYVVQISNGPALEDEDRYASRLLAIVLGDDSGSRMFWELVDPGCAETAAMNACEFQGTGLLMTQLCCAPEDTAENFARIQELLAEAEAEGVTEAELAQAKSKIRSHIVLQSERPVNRLFAVGGNWIARRQYRTVREVIDSYQRVRCEDIAAVMEKYPLAEPNDRRRRAAARGGADPSTRRRPGIGVTGVASPEDAHGLPVGASRSPLPRRPRPTSPPRGRRRLRRRRPRGACGGFPGRGPVATSVTIPRASRGHCMSRCRDSLRHAGHALQLSSVVGVGQRPAFSLVQFHRFFDQLAQFRKHGLLVVAVTAAVEQPRTTADKALILIRPFDDFGVTGGLFHVHVCGCGRQRCQPLSTPSARFKSFINITKWRSLPGSGSKSNRS